MSDSEDPNKVAPGQAGSPQSREFSIQAIHLMRTAQVNGLTQARMADQKASILLGATFLVFSLSISRAMSGEVPVALSVLAAFSFASSLCAVMAVLPSVEPAHTLGSRLNLLFFGYYADLDESAWTEQLLDSLDSDESVYRTMAHDLYQNGVVLKRKKFRYLTLAYRIFIAGLIVTLTVFAFELARSGRV